MKILGILLLSAWSLTAGILDPPLPALFRTNATPAKLAAALAGTSTDAGNFTNLQAANITGNFNGTYNATANYWAPTNSADLLGNLYRSDFGGGFVQKMTNDFWLNSVQCHWTGTSTATNIMFWILEEPSTNNTTYNVFTTSPLYSVASLTLPAYGTSFTTIPISPPVLLTNGGYVYVLGIQVATNASSVSTACWNDPPNAGWRQLMPYFFGGVMGSVAMGGGTPLSSASFTLGGYQVRNITNFTTYLASLATGGGGATNASQVGYTNLGLGVTTVQGALDQVSVLLPKPVFSLPQTLYGCAGHEFRIYYDGVIRDRPPANLEWITFSPTSWQTNRADGIYIDAAYTAARVGTTPISLSVNGGTNVLTTWSGNLVISSQSSGNGTTRKVLVNGDSTTSGGQTLSMLWTFMNTNSGLKLTFCGSKGSSPTNHECVSGTRWSQWYSGDGAYATPFTNGAGAFDFGFYTNSIGVKFASGDWYVWKFGINDVWNLGSPGDDGSLTNVIGTLTNTLYRAISNIQYCVPGMRAAICVTIPPPVSLDQTAWQMAISQQRYKRSRYILAETLCSMTNWSGVYVWPIHAGLDTANNFSTATGPLNAWNAATMTYVSGSVHPANSGYYQIADELWSALLANP